MRFLTATTSLSLLSFCLIGAVLAPRAVAAAPARQQAHDPDIDALIESLADPNPAARQQAKQQLIAAGARARPALLDAWRGKDPRIAPVAGEILLKLPWALPSDPPNVRKLLAGYGDQDEDKRRDTVIRLQAESGSQPALIRLMEEDPSDHIGWTVFAIFRRSTNDELLGRLRQIDVAAADGSPAPARPQALTAAGWAWLTSDWDKGLSLLRRAVDALKETGGGDEGKAAFAYDLLVADALGRRDYDAAADVRRVQAINTPVQQQPAQPDAPSPVDLLFALHADFGALARFDDDLSDYADDLGRPEVMYAMARIHERAGNVAMAQAIRGAALAVGGLQAEDHQRVAVYLQERSWNADAEREYAAMLTCGNGVEPLRKSLWDLTGEYFLAQLAVERGDDAAAAEHFQLAETAFDRAGRPPGQLSEVDLQAQIHCRKLRVARAKHDAAAAQRELNELLTMLSPKYLPGEDATTLATHVRRLRAARAGSDDEPTRATFKREREEVLRLAGGASPDTDSVIEATDYLRELGRADEAKALFEQSYLLQEALFIDPDAPLSLNNLAWLCARCGYRAADAVALARRANAAQPETAGYWDTAAEAALASGDAKTAVQLEERAMTLKPNDHFMQLQLDRFRGAARK